MNASYILRFLSLRVSRLAGDPPIGAERWKPSKGGFSNAIQLVELIRKEHGDYFCVAVAAYAEVHTESWNNPLLPPSQQCKDLDMQRLKAKINAGADFIITQFFFDTDLFADFIKRVRAAGITVPILPGYLPIQNFQSFQKFTSWCKVFFFV
jgi:methylenetetrahydrofolate reductase (NADPH)